MLPALQVVTTASPSLTELARTVTPFALLVLAWMQARSVSDRVEIKAALLVLADKQGKLRDEVTALNAHVGVDGNGIMAQLVVITQKIDALSVEIAETRGSRHIRPGS